MVVKRGLQVMHHVPTLVPHTIFHIAFEDQNQAIRLSRMQRQACPILQSWRVS